MLTIQYSIDFTQGPSTSNSSTFVQPVQVVQNLPSSLNGSSNAQNFDAQAHLTQGDYNNSNNKNNGNRFFNYG